MKNLASLLFSICIASSINAQESHLSNIRQLTFGGDNAEAYFSFDNSKLSLQITNPKQGIPCDQIYMIGLNQPDKVIPKRISNGKGRTTCSYFMPGNESILYASTFEAADSCPPPPAPRKDGKYLWPLYNSFDIYVANLQGEVIKKLTDSPAINFRASQSSNSG